LLEFWYDEDEGSDDDDREIGVQDYKEASPRNQKEPATAAASGGEAALAKTGLTTTTSEPVKRTQRLEYPS
jgi:hypothetical protein